MGLSSAGNFNLAPEALIPTKALCAKRCFTLPSVDTMRLSGGTDNDLYGQNAGPTSMLHQGHDHSHVYSD